MGLFFSFFWGGTFMVPVRENGSDLAPRARRGASSFGTAIGAAAGDTDAWESCRLPFSENRIPLTAHLVFVYCVDEEAGRGCESGGDKFIPLLPPLSVTFLARLAISDDLVCNSASVFPTQSGMDPAISGTFSSSWDVGLVWPLNTWVTPKTTADHAGVLSPRARPDLGLENESSCFMVRLKNILLLRPNLAEQLFPPFSRATTC